MKVLGIESSCDETGASIINNGVQIISNALASSVEIKKKWGGVVPEKAAREQVKCIVPIITETMQMQNAKCKMQNSGTAALDAAEIDKDTIDSIDAIAVTVGPGLIGSLLVGVETAKTLAYVWDRPIVPVNHLIGHVYGCWLAPVGATLNHEQRTKNKNSSRSINSPKFPAVVLLVSGGHTELILMFGHGKFKLLGTTRDDAAGEAFDKTARILGLSYPGGPAIQKAVEDCHQKIKNQKLKIENIIGKSKFKLPRPMIDDHSFDFSFSGLKTAVLREVQEQKVLSYDFVCQMAYEIQESISDVLTKKAVKAVEEFSPKSLLVCGGVAANKRLREKFEEEIGNYHDIKLFFPPVEFCTDNAATVASAAYFNYSPIPWYKVNANPSLTITGLL
jgi:N6-L-threonylcarbamoyladenine synthase